jgi:L-seryl-tRNA(Ser) seleniumtransferase
VRAISKSDLYRKLPGVDELLRRPELAEAIGREGRSAVTEAARAVLQGARARIEAGQVDDRTLQETISDLPEAVQVELRHAVRVSLRSVINATGVILHTNLGRAPLAAGATEHIAEVAGTYSNLEFELETGERGKRDAHLARLFGQLFKEESRPGRELSTIVVNNNAAAVWLALNTLAAGGEVVVSRGELVEIGGSFRIPDVMAQSNAILKEVGTTNRTRVSDYEKAINEKTRALLRVHRSNFEITGFTEQPALGELVALGRERNIPVIEDLGSGSLVDLASMGVRGETSVWESLRAGVEVVTYSGDKLLGGPQAGMLTGRADLIARMRSNSLFRALRVDKLRYAALESTLLAYVKQDYDEIPVLRMMRLSREAIGARTESLAQRLGGVPKLQVQIIDGDSVIGGGAAPSSTLPTRLLAVSIEGWSSTELLSRLREREPAVIARVQEDQVLLDLRTVFPDQEASLVSALRAIGNAG